jgi:hypothetical protein
VVSSLCLKRFSTSVWPSFRLEANAKPLLPATNLGVDYPDAGGRAAPDKLTHSPTGKLGPTVGSDNDSVEGASTSPLGNSLTVLSKPASNVVADTTADAVLIDHCLVPMQYNRFAVAR